MIDGGSAGALSGGDGGADPAVNSKPRFAILTLCDAKTGYICTASAANKRRYAELHGYVSTVKASLDKSGAAGMQRISILQPLADDDWDVANAIKQAMKRPGMDKAQVLFVASDSNLPFGQLREIGRAHV